MAGNIFADGMNAYNDTNDAIQGIQKKRADTQAAPMIAAGNFTGAGQTYGAAGLPLEARQQVVDQQVTTDRAAATATAAKTEQAAEAQRKADQFLHVVDSVQAAPYGQRLARFKAISPTLADLGIDPGHLAAAKEEDFSDSNIASLKAMVGKAAQDYTLGGMRYSGGTNKPIAGVQSLDPTKLNYGPDDGSTAPPAAAPAPAAPAAAQAPQAAPALASGSPRGLRNNNPLNITGQGWDGQSGLDGKFAQFASIDQGIRAADKNLQAYGTRHGINTLAGVINRWAPASDNNDTGSYVQTVARDTGIDPNAPIDLGDPKVRSVLLHSMAKVETGQANPFGTTSAAMRTTPAATDAGVPAAAAPAAPALPGMHLLNTAQPKVVWKSDGKGNLVNENGDRKVDPTAAADAVADPNLVKAIIDGRAPMPTANRAATDPKWQAAMAEAMAQDPTLDGANYGTRVKTRADFATGTAAKTKTALNTALGHAGDLDSQVDALNNTSLRAINQLGNMYAVQTSDPRIKTFNLTKEALLHEAMKVFAGSAGSLQEFSQLAENLDVNDGPRAQHAVIKKLVGLLASKMDALGEQYKTGMGKELDQSQIMSPHASQVFNKISGLPSASASPAPRPGTDTGWGKAMVVSH